MRRSKGAKSNLFSSFLPLCPTTTRLPKCLAPLFLWANTRQQLVATNLLHSNLDTYGKSQFRRLENHRIPFSTAGPTLSMAPHLRDEECPLMARCDCCVHTAQGPAIQRAHAHHTCCAPSPKFAAKEMQTKQRQYLFLSWISSGSEQEEHYFVVH